MTTIRQLLQSTLTQAMRARDRTTMSACRDALSVLDNSTAIPLRDEHRAGAVENARVGAGASDEAGREITEAEALELLMEEIRQLRQAADELDAARPGAGEDSRRQADVLRGLLERHAGEN